MKESFVLHKCNSDQETLLNRQLQRMLSSFEKVLSCFVEFGDQKLCRFTGRGGIVRKASTFSVVLVPQCGVSGHCNDLLIKKFPSFCQLNLFKQYLIICN